MITKENKNFTINLKEGLISQGFKSDVVNNIIEDFVNFAKGGFSKIKVPTAVKAKYLPILLRASCLVI